MHFEILSSQLLTTYFKWLKWRKCLYKEWEECAITFTFFPDFQHSCCCNKIICSLYLVNLQNTQICSVSCRLHPPQNNESCEGFDKIRLSSIEYPFTKHDLVSVTLRGMQVICVFLLYYTMETMMEYINFRLETPNCYIYFQSHIDPKATFWAGMYGITLYKVFALLYSWGWKG